MSDTGNSPAQTAVISKCRDIVETYRRTLASNRSREQSIIELVAALPAETEDRPNYSKSGTLKSYIAMLDAVDAEHGRADGFQGVAGHQDDHEGGDDADESDADSRHSKRTRQPSSSPEPDSKRRRADPSRFAWRDPPLLLGTEPLDPALIRTIQLLREYAIEPKVSKNDLLLSPYCPEFPDSEWTKILAGHAVDLDKVFSGIYSTTRDNITVGRIGDLRFEHQDSTPAVKVATAHHWNTAWQRTVRATVFAFPHRRAELDTYGEWIGGIFTSLDERFHSRVLNFDKSVRKRVGNTRNILLSQFYKFDDLKTSHLSDHGAGFNITSGSLKARKKGEPCERWNHNKCHSQDDARNCRYAHVCSTCHGAHMVTDCPSTTSG